MRDTIFIYPNKIVKIPISEPEEEKFKTMNILIDIITMLVKVPYGFHFDGDLRELESHKTIKIPDPNGGYFIITDRDIKAKGQKRVTRPALRHYLENLLLPSVVSDGFLASGEFRGVNKVMAQRKFDFCEGQWTNFDAMFQNDRECKNLEIKERGNFEKSKMLIGLIKSGGFKLTDEGKKFIDKYKPIDEGPVKDVSKWDRHGNRLPVPGRDPAKCYDITPSSWDTSATGLKIRDRRKVTKEEVSQDGNT